MDAGLDVSGRGSSMGLGTPSSVLRAYVPGVGVFLVTWNETVRIPVPPGEHVVALWARLARKKHQGLSHARVSVGPDQVVGLTWRLPDTLFGHGAIVAGVPGPPRSYAVADATAPPSGLGPCQLTLGPQSGPAPGQQPAVPAQPAVPGQQPVPGQQQMPSQPVPPTPGYAGPPASALPPPGWHPDPTGRCPLRWWDGARWTEHVSDGRGTATDVVAGL